MRKDTRFVSKKICWKRVDDLIARNIRSLCTSLLPGGKINKRHEYIVKNPIRGDRHQGSFSVHVGSGPKCGMWYDFATHQGGDFISLWCYIRGSGLTRIEAARQILSQLGEKTE